MYLENSINSLPDCFNDLLDDLNTPLYISKLHDLFNQSQKGNSDKRLEFNRACRLVGLFNETVSEREKFKKSKAKISEEMILKKIKDRENAKKVGNYKLADKLRAELVNDGIDIKDVKGKTIWNYK